MDNPQFLGIGAARAGTTWLFKQLDRHPDVWMPRIKELHYFTRSTAYSGPSHLSTEGRLPRLIGCGPGPDKYRSHFIRALGSNILKPSMTKLRWDARYFFGTPGNAWYRSLFNDAGDKVAGEITPRYSVLTRWDIQKLREDFPGIRILYIMRDPVDRLWSHVRMIAGRRDADGVVSARRCERILSRTISGEESQIVRRSDYAGALKRLAAAVPGGKLLIEVFEEMVSGEGLARICDFLGIGRVAPCPAPVHAGQALAMSPDQRRRAAHWLAPQYEAAHAALGRMPEAWGRKV